MGHAQRNPGGLPPPRPPLPPPPPPSPSSEANFPILAISLLGILTTAILLLSYYIFVIKCCLNWHRSDAIRRLSRSRRWRYTDDHLFSSVYSTTINDRGLEDSAIRQIPTFRFRREENNSFQECAVCLNEFQEDERIRLLPNCFHVFHIDCIDTWLQTHANCPLCRSDITTSPTPNPIQFSHPNLNSGDSVVIEVRDEGSDQTPRTEARSDTSTTDPCVGKKERKLHKISSMGDEFIDVRGKDEQFYVQPMRRSFSMDSSSDRQLYMAVQEILRQNPHFVDVGNSEGCSSGPGRNRRSFFSFGNCRSSKNAALPIKNEM